MQKFLGIDLGSVSVKIVVIDEESNIVKWIYRRHKGKVIPTIMEILDEIKKEIPPESIRNTVITGIPTSSQRSGYPFSVENEIVCQARSAQHLYPDVKTVIEMGGQDSKLILLDYDRELKEAIIKDFATNTICAAGTGSFLDQQANRLGVAIEKEFGEMALQSQSPPRIAGRCSVFAKTDMIHLQQEATPVYDIVAGLCFAVARNFISSIAKGKNIVAPVAFHGGVASNQGMCRAFKELLKLGEKDFIIPQLHEVMGALGAALIARDKKAERYEQFTMPILEKFLKRGQKESESLPPLKIKLSKTSTSPSRGYMPLHSEKIEGYLGVDVGSISTNLVVINEKGTVMSKRYLMTAGRPLEAVKTGLAEISEELQDEVIIKGVCTTGSGRYLTGEFLGADIVKNEITAQAAGAVFIDPTVDTIFEIGGQDSKYISIEKGAIVDFEMNKVCAAGTGSFLEEQAEKLGISIKKEFGRMALKAKHPVAMGERCTVFIETDLVSNQQKGASTEDLVAGLAYSIAYNYLNKVVGDKKVGNNIFFQGGTAYNDAVVAAFEQILGKRITVPNHHEVTGAIGCALLAKQWHQESGGAQTRFKGFNRAKIEYQQDSFECQACSNRCEIKRVAIQGEKDPILFGGRCERYEVKKDKEKIKKIPDLFKEREQFLLMEYNNQDKKEKSGKKVIGIPRILHFYEYLPFWTRFFKELGFDVELSDPTNKNIIHQGISKVLAEYCFPVKIAHGAVANLMEKHVDYIFLPSILGLKKVYQDYPESAPCPYVQAIPYTLRTALNLDKQKQIEILSPVVDFSRGKQGMTEGLRSMAETLGVKYKEIRRAVEAGEDAQSAFNKGCYERGKQILANLKTEDNAVVIVSRPYNGCDPCMNLEIPKKLRNLGSLAIPMDFLPLDEIPLDKEWPFMTWRYGQKILASAGMIKKDPRLNALYLTNFGCGPDSFLLKFFRKRMGGKVFLQIEVDEHSADVGAITRCEAFLDSMGNIRDKKTEDYRLSIMKLDKKEQRTLYIPWMCDHAHVLKSAFGSCGVPAEVLPESDMETLYWGRKYTTGKECYPCIVTTGDMVKFIKSNGFDPKKVAFFMPTAGGGCRFGYYNILQRVVLDEVGVGDIPIFSPHQTQSFLEDLGVISGDFFRRAWQGIVAMDFLEKALRETRPYELNKGETHQIYWEYVLKLCNSVMKKEDITPVLKEARRAFEKIPIDRKELRPVVGIVGEIFVRMHRFSNNNIVTALEDLGAEVWVAPFLEWVFYLNVTRKEDYKQDKDVLSLLKLSIEDKVARDDEHHIAKIWEDFLRSAHEPPAEESIRMGADYVDPSFRGEAILSLGKMVDYYKTGLSGVINLMPFTCMPGTIVNSQLKRIQENCGDIPVLNVVYDGLDMTNNNLRLEAYIHQCRQYMERNLKVGV